MSEGMRPRWKTAITDVQGDEIFYRGYPFLELAGKYDFASIVYLMFKGELPTPAQAKALNALMVAVVDHGIAPSEVVARIQTASGSPIQAAIAAGILTVGDIHGGAGEALARDFRRILEEGKKAGKTIDQMAEDHVAQRRAARQPVEGFGHPLHPAGDPRAPWLMDYADKVGVSGEHMALARAIEKALEKRTGRHIPMNIDGASASLLCDLGIDWRFSRPILIVARTVGLAAHAVEESVRERGWRIIAEPEEVIYDGPPHRPVP